MRNLPPIRSTAHIWRAPLWFLAALMLPVLAGCSGGENVTTRALNKARQLWERARVRDYNLEWITTGARNGHYLVYVRGGKVREIRIVEPDGRQIEAHPGDPSYYGIDGLFRIIEEEQAQCFDDRPFGQPKGAHILLKFTPDPKLGYPRRYRRDVVGSRQGLAIDVIKLDTNPPGAIPPLPPPPSA